MFNTGLGVTMPCKKTIEAEGGVLKWLTSQYNTFSQGKWEHAPIAMIMGKGLYQYYEDNLQANQKWVPAIFSDGTPITAKDIGPVLLMFKSTRCYPSKKLGWALTIVGPYGILEV